MEIACGRKAEHHAIKIEEMMNMNKGCVRKRGKSGARDRLSEM